MTTLRETPLQDETPGSCSEESPSNRFVCTLPSNHLRWHAALDLNDHIAFAWPPKHMPGLEVLAAELDAKEPGAPVSQDGLPARSAENIAPENPPKSETSARG